jgi:hypothetical protein
MPIILGPNGLRNDMRVILQRGKRAGTPRAHTGPFSTGSRRKIQRFVLFWTPNLDLTCSLFFSYHSGERGPMVNYRLYRCFHRLSRFASCAISVASQHLTFVCGVIAQASSIFIRPLNLWPDYLFSVQIEYHFQSYIVGLKSGSECNENCSMSNFMRWKILYLLKAGQARLYQRYGTVLDTTQQQTRDRGTITRKLPPWRWN